MNEIPADEVSALVYGFMQRCFIGAVPKRAVSVDETAEMRKSMQEWLTLEPEEVATWGESRNAALYKLLSDALITLQLHRGMRFPAEVLQGSSEQLLSQPLLTVLATVPDPSGQ